LALIQRVLIGMLGAGLTLVGFALFLAIYAPDEYAEPLSLWKKAVVLILGVAVGAVGIWLVRYSLRRSNPD
jgi:hypothetical protein